MDRLIIAPHEAAADKWSHAVRDTDAAALAVTLPQLARRVLRVYGKPYREHKALELLAAWEAVDQQFESLHRLRPVSRFPGFVEEIRDVFDAAGMGEPILDRLSGPDKQEIIGLLQSYREWTRERYILDRAERTRIAAELWETSVLGEVQSVERWYLPELSPVEEGFLQVVCQSRTVSTHKLPPDERRLTARVLPEPRSEVDWICRQINCELQEGVRPSSVAVALPNPGLYLSLFLRALTQWGVPFEPPPPTLMDVSIGRAFWRLFEGNRSGWRKSDLRLLTAPGWGFPFTLNTDARRQLRLTPPVKGLVRQREHLGDNRQLGLVLDQLSEWTQQIRVQPLSAYAELLQRMLDAYPRDLWAAGDSTEWALHASAWRGLERLCEWLADTKGTIEPHRFVSLLELLMSQYVLPNPQVFYEGISIVGLDAVVGMDYDLVFVPGLVEGSIPSPRPPHWLTRQVSEPDSDILKRVAAACQRLLLSYPETDMEGKPNLPSPFLDDAEHAKTDGANRVIKPRRLKPFVQLSDAAVKERASQRVLDSGMSASRLNVYTKCPYQYFCRFVLGLEADEAVDDEVSPLDEGSLVHQVLYLFWENGGRHDITDLAEAVFGEARKPLSPRLLNRLKSFAWKDKQMTEERGLRPYWLERQFSGLIIATRFGDVEMHGVFDRVDTTPAGDYVLYDYKTGKAPSVADIRRGVELQLPVYVLAAEEALSGEVLGAVFFSLQDIKQTGFWRSEVISEMGVRKSSSCLAKEEWEREMHVYRGFLQSYLEAILSGEFPIEPRDPHSCLYCPYSNVCRREVYR